MKKDAIILLPKFVIRKSAIENKFMRLEYKDRLILGWTADKTFASNYPSKYAAKNHLKSLKSYFELPESLMIEQLTA